MRGSCLKKWVCYKVRITQLVRKNERVVQILDDVAFPSISLSIRTQKWYFTLELSSSFFVRADNMFVCSLICWRYVISILSFLGRYVFIDVRSVVVNSFIWDKRLVCVYCQIPRSTLERRPGGGSFGYDYFQDPYEANEKQKYHATNGSAYHIR